MRGNNHLLQKSATGGVAVVVGCGAVVVAGCAGCAGSGSALGAVDLAAVGGTASGIEVCLATQCHLQVAAVVVVQLGNCSPGPQARALAFEAPQVGGQAWL